ncbi:MAG TPA: GNAT family N-acetyltransferase [Spirochaetia bacterium]|nr:GNAT family N-acetyltransferase [Spirochaetia bacterium]
MVIERALAPDAEGIWLLQRLVYRSEADIYDDYTIEPLTQSVDDIEKQFADHTILKAVIEGTIIGSVRASSRDGTCYIGKLIVHPDCQNRGIGKKLMAEIETCFRTADRFELFTGSKSVKNIRLYESLGYGFLREEPVVGNFKLVFMVKAAQKPAG